MTGLDPLTIGLFPDHMILTYTQGSFDGRFDIEVHDGIWDQCWSKSLPKISCVLRTTLGLRRAGFFGSSGTGNIGSRGFDICWHPAGSSADIPAVCVSGSETVHDFVPGR